MTSRFSMTREYSMLNPEGKDAVPIARYAVRVETMGDRIRALRQARGYTLERLAQLAGVTKSAVHQWEDGSTKNLRLVTFLKVLEALHTDANYLIWGPSRQPHPSSPGSSSRRPTSRPPET